MGFHCGNTPSNKLAFCEMKYQLIMARSLAAGSQHKGTLEGDIAPGDITFYRLQSTSDSKAPRIRRSRVRYFRLRHVPSEVSVFSQFRKWERFYRHVLIEKNYPASRSSSVRSFWKDTL